MPRCNNVEAAQGRYGNRGDDHGVAACDAHRNLDDVDSGSWAGVRMESAVDPLPTRTPWLTPQPNTLPSAVSAAHRSAPYGWSSVRRTPCPRARRPLTPRGRPSPAERHARRTAGHRPGHRAARHRNAPCPAGSRPAAATSGPWLRAVLLRRTCCAIKPVIRHKAAVLVVRWHPMSRTRGVNSFVSGSPAWPLSCKRACRDVRTS